MILFFDTYITDKPLEKSFVAANEKVRSRQDNYKMPSKIQIAKYTLESYKKLPWSKVIVRYGFSNNYKQREINQFDKYIKKLFPISTVFAGRGPTLVQNDFMDILNIINKNNDDLIFYSPNNDHPYIASSYNSIFESISLAKSYMRSYEFVSIVYSHFSEFVGLGKSSNPFHQRFALDSVIVENNPIATVLIRKNGDNSSVQIVSKKLFNYWFSSHKLGDAPLMRAESLREHFITHNQLMIIPKKEICAHFDGYAHTIGSRSEIQPSLVPPLFIPPGFFNHKINISFGYDKYRQGWVNINPNSNHYIFEDHRNGTDLKINLSDLPMSWRGRVNQVDINPDLDWDLTIKNRDFYYMQLSNPWSYKYILHNLLKYILPSGKKNLRSMPDFERFSVVGLSHHKKSINIHLGCGPRVLKDWVNLDLFYEPYEKYMKYYTNKFYSPAIRGNKFDFYGINIVAQPWPIDNNSVATVFHEDFIEHLDQKEQYLLLSEVYRVLKVGGVHRINTPDITSSMKIHSNFVLGYSGVYKAEWDKHVHKNILSVATLSQMAKLIGYRKVLVQKRDLSIAKIPKEYRPDPKDRPETGNIYIDLIK